MFRTATIRTIGLVAAMALGATGAPAGETKERPRVVLELFTSQGCSSCPPADALLEELGGRDEVVALGYHVDYWDYIGWADTFGSPAYSDLQRDYARSFGERRIYTPQLVVNGEMHVVGSRRDEVMAALDTYRLVLPIKLSQDGEFLSIEIGGDVTCPEAVVWLISFRQQAEVMVERGENGGKALAYSNIVTGRQALGMFEPEAGARMRLPLADVLAGGADAIAVLVQVESGGLPGKILGAASLAL